jgi:hypothetical protein
MKLLLSVMVMLGAVLATMVPHVGPVETHVPRTYKMDLSQSPKERWAPIVRDYH